MKFGKRVLEKIINGLNDLESGIYNNITFREIPNEDDANELKGYLKNYNVEIEKAFWTDSYILKLSKKEKVA